MLKKLIILSLALVAVGCAGNMYQPLQNNDLQQLQMASDIDVYYKSSFFWLETATATRESGLLPKYISDKTGATGIPPSAEYVKKFSITPPVHEVKEHVVKSFNTTLGAAIGNVHEFEVDLSGSLEDQISANSNSSDYYLVLDNTGWISSYFVTDWDTQWFAVSTKGSLVRRDDNQVIWKGFCNANGREDPKLTLDTKFMMTDNAQLVKDILSYGAESCAKQLLQQLAGNFPMEG